MASTTPILRVTDGAGLWQRQEARKCTGAEARRAPQRHVGVVRVWAERPQPRRPGCSRVAAAPERRGASGAEVQRLALAKAVSLHAASLPRTGPS